MPKLRSETRKEREKIMDGEEQFCPSCGRDVWEPASTDQNSETSCLTCANLNSDQTPQHQDEHNSGQEGELLEQATTSNQNARDGVAPQRAEAVVAPAMPDWLQGLIGQIDQALQEVKQTSKESAKTLETQLQQVQQSTQETAKSLETKLTETLQKQLTQNTHSLEAQLQQVKLSTQQTAINLEAQLSQKMEENSKNMERRFEARHQETHALVLEIRADKEELGRQIQETSRSVQRLEAEVTEQVNQLSQRFTNERGEINRQLQQTEENLGVQVEKTHQQQEQLNNLQAQVERVITNSTNQQQELTLKLAEVQTNITQQLEARLRVHVATAIPSTPQLSETTAVSVANPFAEQAQMAENGEQARSTASQFAESAVASQTSTRNFLRAPKIGDLPTFDPDADTVLPSSYLERLLEDCRLYGISTAELLPIMPRVMLGAARMWIDNQMHLFRNFEDFKSAFLRNFQNEQVVQRKLARLRNTRFRPDGKKSLRAFFWEQVGAFRELCPTMSEAEILSSVKSMLPIRIQRQLIGIHLTDTEQLSMVLWDNEELDRLESFQRERNAYRSGRRRENQQQFGYRERSFNFTRRKQSSQQVRNQRQNRGQNNQGGRTRRPRSDTQGPPRNYNDRQGEPTRGGQTSREQPRRPPRRIPSRLVQEEPEVPRRQRRKRRRPNQQNDQPPQQPNVPTPSVSNSQNRRLPEN